jgi:hypothetical protein
MHPERHRHLGAGRAKCWNESYLEGCPDTIRQLRAPLSLISAIGPQAKSDTFSHNRDRSAIYFSRKCWIPRNTEAYMAGVTRPVWVFC